MASKKCPVCGATVKVENLERHVRNQHPRETIDVSALVTKEERRAVREDSRRRRKVTPGGFRIVLIVAVIVALLVLILILNPFGGPIVRVGDGAPDFEVPACPSGSDPARLSSIGAFPNGSPVVLELMDVDCEQCQDEAPVLASVHRNYSGRGVRFLSVSLIDWVGSADTCQTIGKFQSDYGTSWTYGMDVNRDVRRLYPFAANEGTPMTYILNRSGVVAAKIVGRAENGFATYAGYLEDVLAVPP